MSTALATAPERKTSGLSALAQMASNLNLEPERMKAVLKATVFKSCTNDEELAALVVVSNTYNLNPLLKEIYAFPAKGGGIVPVVSIDGWVKLANNHPQMDGMQFEFHHDGNGALTAVTCRIHRKDRNHPMEVTEYLAECERNTEPWKMKHRMLRHKALKECVRYAFGFSGIYDEDDAHAMRDVTPAPTSDRPPRSAPPAQTIEDAFGGDAIPLDAETAVDLPIELPTVEFIPGQAIEEVKEMLHDAAITDARFDGMLKKAKLISTTETFGPGLKVEKLRKIYDNAAAIIAGTYNAGGDQ